MGGICVKSNSFSGLCSRLLLHICSTYTVCQTSRRSWYKLLLVVFTALRDSFLFFLALTLKTLCCFLAKLDGPKPDTILRTVWSCIPSNFPFLNGSWHSPHDTQQSASWASHYNGVFLTTSGPNHQNLVLSALCPQFLQNPTSWQDESISCHTVFMMPGTFWWCVHVLLLILGRRQAFTENWNQWLFWAYKGTR